MKPQKNINTIGIPLFGTNATQILNDTFYISLEIGVIDLKTLRVLNAEKFGSTFSYNGVTMPVLVLDDISKVTFDFCDPQGAVLLKDVPASGLTDLNDKQRTYYNCFIDLSKSIVNLQTAIAGTPGWLLLEYETN